MKIRQWSSVVLLSLAASGAAQTITSGHWPPPGYTVIGRDAHTRTWARLSASTNGTPSGKFVELQTGACFLDPATGRWEDSSPDFQVTADGHAVALRCQHKLVVSPTLDDPEGVVDLQMPDGQRLRTAVLGLVLYSPRTGQSLQVAAVKDSVVGQQTAPDEVTFFDAFQGLRASVRIRNERGQCHQDVLLSEQLTPSQVARLGFADTNGLRLEAWTEVLEAPAPAIQTVVIQTETNAALRPLLAEPDTVDQGIAFPTMRLAGGRSFVEPDETGRSAVVFKQWVQASGRVALVEAVNYAELLPLMQSLPVSKLAALEPRGARIFAAKERKERKGSGLRPTGAQMDSGPAADRNVRAPVVAARTPPARPKPAKGGPYQIAKTSAVNPASRRPQVIIDYTAINGTLASYTCQGDVTYLLNGPFYVNQLRLEGNTVLKVDRSSAATIVATNVTCASGPYRPAIITCIDQNGVGENIGSGNPSGYYGGVALDLSAASSPVLSNLRFSYLSNALAGTNITLRDAQIIRCKKGFTAASSRARLYNVLVWNVDTLVNDTSAVGDDVTAESLTVHYCTNFVTDTSGTVRLTNSLFVCATNWQCTYIYTNGCAFLNSDAGVFQTVGGASHYLADGSPYRGAGTTNTSLLAALKNKTSYPPIVYSNATISVDTILGPQAQRCTGIPDLGFVYDPLDYAFGGTTANANLTFAPGTAVGWFRTTSGWYHAGHGIHMADTKIVTFDGRVDAPDYWVRCIVAQEGCNGLWEGGYGPGGITGWAWPDLANSPQIVARFTRFSVLANDTHHFRDDYGWLIANATSCEFYSGAVGYYNVGHHYTNCLFERTPIWLNTDHAPSSVSVRNCTMHGGYFSPYRFNDGLNAPAVARENAFDGTTVQNTSGGTTYYNYNAYLTNASRTVPAGANDVIVTNFNWQPSWLGTYYLPTNSPLIDAGGVTADQIGLYQFTTQTNQVKEGTSQVDISYHYVALDAGGRPIDTDGDTLPDYLEDFNGNGVVDPGETDWQVYNSPNGLAGGSGLQVFTPLK